MSVPTGPALVSALDGREYPRLRRRHLGPDELPVDFNGSWNIAPVGRAAQYVSGQEGAGWMHRHIQNQLRGVHGFLGKEFGSRLYTPAVVAAVEGSIVRAQHNGNERLLEDARTWLTNLYALVALCSVSEAPKRREDPSLPFSTFTGMRTPSWFMTGCLLDAQLHVACGHTDLPRPYERAYRKRRANYRWPVTACLMAREEGDPLDVRTAQKLRDLRQTGDVELFLELWSNPPMRTDFHVHIAGRNKTSWISRNTNGNKGPLYLLSAGPGHIVGAHPDSDKGKGYAGTCRRDGGRLLVEARAGNAHFTLPPGPWRQVSVLDRKVEISEGN